MRRLRPRPLSLAFLLLLAAGASLVAAPGLRGLFGAVLAALMLAIAVCDARRFVIPDEFIAAALALAFLHDDLLSTDAGLQSLADCIVRAAAIALAFFLVMIGYRVSRGRDGIGLGDVKLAAVAGAWLDWLTIFGVIEGAALTAIATYLVVARRRRRPVNATHLLPFGAFLAPAIWVGWLAERLMGWN